MTISKHDWDNALDAWIIEERERLGGPPMPEEVIAFTAGELPKSEAARVRALLVYYPELTSLLDEAAPPRRIFASQNFARTFAMAASVAVVVLSVLLVQKTRESQQPFAYTSRHTLDMRQSRGPATSEVYALPVGEDQYLLEVLLPEDLSYRDYRVDIVDVRRSKIVWSKAGAHAPFAISIQRRFLRPGTYRMDVYGTANGRTEAVERCWLRAR